MRNSIADKTQNSEPAIVNESSRDDYTSRQFKLPAWADLPKQHITIGEVEQLQNCKKNPKLEDFIAESAIEKFNAWLDMTVVDKQCIKHFKQIRDRVKDRILRRGYRGQKNNHKRKELTNSADTSMGESFLSVGSQVESVTNVLGAAAAALPFHDEQPHISSKVPDPLSSLDLPMELITKQEIMTNPVHWFVTQGANPATPKNIALLYTLIAAYHSPEKKVGNDINIRIARSNLAIFLQKETFLLEAAKKELALPAADLFDETYESSNQWFLNHSVKISKYLLEHYTNIINCCPSLAGNIKSIAAGHRVLSSKHEKKATSPRWLAKIQEESISFLRREREKLEQKNKQVNSQEQSTAVSLKIAHGLHDVKQPVIDVKRKEPSQASCEELLEGGHRKKYPKPLSPIFVHSIAANQTPTTPDPEKILPPKKRLSPRKILTPSLFQSGENVLSPAKEETTALVIPTIV